MRFVTDRPTSWQSCISCGNEMTDGNPAVRCQFCGGLLEVRHRPPQLTRQELLDSFIDRRGARPGRPISGVWRFREVILPGATDPITFPEGNTPLLQREPLDRWTGIPDLFLKHEGYNPTGSFKDRGMTVGVTQAVRIGARAVACASTGNTAASMAAYAAQAELPALVLLPAGGVALGKLAQTLAYGARAVAVRGDFDACLRLTEEAATQLGVYLLNSINPYRIEGQKTIVLELLQQFGWKAPDWLVFPAGNLGNTAAFGKALREAHEWGLIDSMPRLAAVQAAGAAPFVRSFEEGFARPCTVTADTIASAIRIGNPASYPRAVGAIRDTNGVVISVTDEEILEAKAAVDGCGVGCEPASAAAVAGARQLARSGEIRAGQRVVAVLTGHILKDPEILLERGGPITEIEPDLGALEKVLDGF